MKEEKLEQLRTVFKIMLSRMIKEIEEGQNIKGTPAFSNYYADQLLYEVKIRINNK